MAAHRAAPSFLRARLDPRCFPLCRCPVGWSASYHTRARLGWGEELAAPPPRVRTRRATPVHLCSTIVAGQGTPALVRVPRARVVHLVRVRVRVGIGLGLGSTWP
eukprot:scaffold103799_cov48-Phaeocystis_antarctica.AAC.1